MLSPAALLDLFERGDAAAPLRRADLVLAASRAGRDGGPDDVRRLTPGSPTPGPLTPGQRNAALLAAYGQVAGPVLGGVADCPACGGRVDVEMAVADLLAAAPTDGTPAPALRAGPLELTLRLPEAGDLAAAAAAGGREAARRALARACIVEARQDGAAVAPPPLDDDLVDAIAASLAEADPLAEIALDLVCPACGEAWSARLDPLVQLWDEVGRQAAALLREVADLARAYGWTEPDVLALSPWRRRRYLELAAP